MSPNRVATDIHGSRNGYIHAQRGHIAASLGVQWVLMCSAPGT